MATAKISDLAAANIPLAGTEQILLTQSGASVQTALANLPISTETQNALNQKLSSETVTSLTFDNSTNTFTYTDENSATTDISLSVLNTFIDSAAFNTANGELTLTRTDAGTVTVDLDGRFLTDYSVTQADVTQHEAALSITESQISDLQTYLTTETVTSIAFNNATNTLSFTDENSATTDIDLSLYVDDTNLARLTSGTLNGSTGVATFTRDDATSFTLDFSPLFDDTNLARITSADFTNGILTLTRDDATTVTADLDGRYLNAGALNATVDNSLIVGNDLTVNSDALISGSLQVGPQSYDLSVENNRVGINTNNPSCVLDVASAESPMEIKFRQPAETSELITLSLENSSGSGSSISSFFGNMLLSASTVFAGSGQPTSSEQFEVNGNIQTNAVKDSSGNTMLSGVVATGQVSLSGNVATVATGISAVDATFMLAIGIDDPNADSEVAGALFWDDSVGQYYVRIRETETNVNPTVNYDVIRVR